MSFKSLVARFRYEARIALKPPTTTRYSEIDLFYRILNRTGPSGFMLDVGAQFGESSRPFLNRGWKVLAFEPDPNPRKQESLARMFSPSFELRRVAVSNVPRENMTFYTSEESTGISGLSAFRETHRATCEVRVSTLALELQEYAFPRVDFLKIDTEGFDHFVLQGYPWAERPVLKPRAILCEFEDLKTLPLGYNWSDMAQFLSCHGYTVLVSEWYPIVRYGSVHTWKQVFPFNSGQSVDPKAWGNLLAFQSPKDAECYMQHARRFLPQIA